MLCTVSSSLTNSRSIQRHDTKMKSHLVLGVYVVFANFVDPPFSFARATSIPALSLGAYFYSSRRRMSVCVIWSVVQNGSVWKSFQKTISYTALNEVKARRAVCWTWRSAGIVWTTHLVKPSYPGDRFSSANVGEGRL